MDLDLGTKDSCFWATPPPKLASPLSTAGRAICGSPPQQKLGPGYLLLSLLQREKIIYILHTLYCMMKTPNIQHFFLFLLYFTTTSLLAQTYKSDGGFNGGSLELKGNTYSFVQWFCTGQYFSKGTFIRKGDTLYLTSSAEYDDRELRIAPKWIEESDSIRVSIKLRGEHQMSDFQHAIISFVGKDSIGIKLEGHQNISIPISFLPIHEIYFDQKRVSLFFACNDFVIHYYKPYEGQFVRMVNEPFISRGNSIHPYHSNTWGYLWMETSD